MVLLDAALGLSQAATAVEAMDRILASICRLAPADAAVVLALGRGGTLKVLAQRGLVPAAHRIEFDPCRHVRLHHGLQARGPLRYTDAAESDPYDGLLACTSAELLPIHACVVAPLRIGPDVVGLLTLDALNPGGLDGISNHEIAVFAALTSAALRQERLLDELRACRTQALPEGAGDADEVFGPSPAMQNLRSEIELLARLQIPVLVLGETGVGKERVARALHARSPRAERPLITVNCAALPEQLLESELFGHAGGAFTGATRARLGRFAAAHGGTLFLDEIGELSPGAQAVLLRALQEGEIQRVGEDRSRRVDVRVLAATNRDLEREVEAGRFRADLYYRLAVYPLRVPPLRERPEDIPGLVDHFGREIAAQLGARFAPVGEDVLRALRRCPWPGNVRELRNVVSRALLRHRIRRRHADGDVLELLLADLLVPTDGAAAQQAGTSGGALIEPETLAQSLDRVRRQAMADALSRSGGNVAQAARQLGLSRSFAYKEAVRLGLLPARPRCS